ncbi:glycosyltransferase family 2 protein [Sphingosinithalassobacter sp. CS137]|uniref:glycosyltransferase family 2 protein n=1 Tax=Sphingosinithalassobacter sp. CS137 TaxID=2762748 RepID=UPI00165DFA7E|nr:glycosyltransferase family 2 protein [Sphingosinithalassobacter sp. CS137]
MTTAIITMAGFGRRFLDAGYTVPKYCIEVHDRSLFCWSMASLRGFIEAGADFVFIVRSADAAADFIAREARKAGIARFEIVELDAPTDGQATTAMLAAPAVARSAEPMLIYNIDTFVHPDMLPAPRVRGEGWIPCFAAEGDHWSFVRTDANGRAVEVREKVRIAPHATIGLYWFGSFDLYARTYHEFYADPANLEANERYVAPMYNHLIRQGSPVYIHDVPLEAVVPLGVPRDVEAFRESDPPHL